MSASESEKAIASKLGVTDRTIRRYSRFDILTAKDSEIGEQIDSVVKGSSTLYDENGQVKLRWVKTDNKWDSEQAREWMEALAEKLPRAAVTRPREIYNNTLTVIPFGDPHIGMYAWAEEAGDDFDLEIATADLCAAVDRLVKSAPSSQECLIANLGDYFHADNSLGETMRSHHKLDTDTRWAKVLLAGLKAMRQCIASALTHHEKVTVINAIGNHDDHSSMFLTIALKNIYENEPRIHIIDNPTIVHYYTFGNSLIGVHHGHTIKPDKLPLIMATDRPEDWGRCKHRLWLCGHLHADILREYQGVKVETFRTLSARDAWAASMGYKSGRDMKALIIHPEWGEVARHIVSIDMLRRVDSDGEKE